MCVSQANGDTRWVGGLTKIAIYPTCANLLQKAVVHTAPILGSMGYKAANYPVNLQTTIPILTKGTQDNLGYMQVNK